MNTACSRNRKELYDLVFLSRASQAWASEASMCRPTASSLNPSQDLQNPKSLNRNPGLVYSSI